MHTQRFTILTKDLQYATTGFDRDLSAVAQALREEVDPSLIVASFAQRIQLTVVVFSMLFEIQARVQQGPMKNVIVTKYQRDQQATDASVAIEEWNRFELRVRQRGLYYWVGLLVQKALEVCQTFREEMRRRWNKRGIPRPIPTDPVLGTPKFPRLLVSTSTFREQ